MSLKLYPEEDIQNIASAIRDKNGLSDLYTVGEMAQAIEDIPSGGGDDPLSWSEGSDNIVAALIDGAQSGVIDLEQDCGWQVGDVRVITVGAFTDGANVAHVQQQAELVITSFSDYENCGCSLQVDFKNSLLEQTQMAFSGVNYENTEMYRNTLPIMANALPSWLKNRLTPFEVDIWPWSSSSGGAHRKIGNNLLALRSNYEITGNAPYNEGSRLDYYYQTQANRIKKIGISGSADAWFTRSRGSNSTNYVYISSSGGDGGASYSVKRYLSPFMCLGGVQSNRVLTIQLNGYGNSYFYCDYDSSENKWYNPTGESYNFIPIVERFMNNEFFNNNHVEISYNGDTVLYNIVVMLLTGDESVDAGIIDDFIETRGERDYGFWVFTTPEPTIDPYSRYTYAYYKTPFAEGRATMGDGYFALDTGISDLEGHEFTMVFD